MVSPSVIAGRFVRQAVSTRRRRIFLWRGFVYDLFLGRAIFAMFIFGPKPCDVHVQGPFAVTVLDKLIYIGLIIGMFGVTD